MTQFYINFSRQKHQIELFSGFSLNPHFFFTAPEMIPRAWQLVSASVSPEEPSHTAILWLVYQFKLLLKELSSCNKFLFINLYICATRCCRYFKLWILLNQTVLSLKYQRFTSSSCEDIRIRKFKFVARTQYTYLLTNTFFLNLF